MDIVRLIGIESRDYTDKSTGELKSFCGLYVVYEQMDGEEKGLIGKKCDNISCPRDIDLRDLEIGECYELKYAHYKTKNGLAARVSGLELCDDPAVVGVGK